MICQECKAEGKKSRVEVGVTSRTAAYYAPFYDEEGKYHDHDGNVGSTRYSCSNGHQWSESSRSSCWCGWPNKDTTAA